MSEKYNQIGTNYNSTRKADPYLTEQLHHHLQPTTKGTYLDIGCGTGNYTLELHKKGINLIGIDPSELMLKKARQRNEQIEWRIGTAEDTGLQENAVDGVIATLTIHHWTDLKKGFTELRKVAKPDSRIVIFTSTPQQMRGYWLNHYFPQLLLDSIAQMPSFEHVQKALDGSGIELLETHKYFIRPDLKDQFLYCGKHDPTRYFDEQVRQGISSFSSLANRLEVEEGLLHLQKDIQNGNIESVIKQYENNLGDYLYIIGQCR